MEALLQCRWSVPINNTNNLIYCNLHVFFTVAHKAFPKSISVIEAMKDLCADRRAGPPRELTADMVSQNLDKITKYLKGLKVVFQLPNKPSTRRTVGVNGLDKPADAAVFTLDNGQQCTVANYFSGSKQYRLQYPKLPCLWVGSRQKHVLLPPEVIIHFFLSTDLIISLCLVD